MIGCIIFILSFAAAESALKYYIERFKISRTFMKGSILIRPCRNRGIIFGIFSKKKYAAVIIQTIVFCIVAIPLGMIFLSASADIGAKIGATLLLAGALSNVSDRWIRGCVVDYIRFPRLEIKRLSRLVFDLADFMIFGGAIILLISLF